MGIASRSLSDERGQASQARSLGASEFLAALRARESAPWEALVDEQYEPLLSLVRSLGVHQTDVDDLAQDVFLKAFQQIHKFRGDSSVRTWLWRVALNTCRDHHRKPRWQGAPLPSQGDEEPQPADQHRLGDDPAHEVVAQKERRTAIRQGVLSLPRKLRAPVVLRFYHDLSGAEIAALLRCSESTVWSRIYAGLRALSSTLPPWLKEDFA
jgi:RNA polymerase sigma-70 factor (ECF subfamily)